MTVNTSAKGHRLFWVMNMFIIMTDDGFMGTYMYQLIKLYP